MLTPIFRTTLAAALLAGTALTSQAAEVFNRIATFHVVDNLPEGADPKQSDRRRDHHRDARTARRSSIPTAPASGSASSTSPIPRRRRRRAWWRSTASRHRWSSWAARRWSASSPRKSKAKPSGYLAVVDLATQERSRPPAISAGSPIRSPRARTARSSPSPSRTSATRRSMKAPSRSCRAAI